MTEQVKNEGIEIEATKIEDAEAEALIAEAEAEAKEEAESTPEATPEASPGDDEGDAHEPIEEPDEEPKDEEPEETPKGDNDGDMSIDYIEERIDELMDKGRANWSKEERREYRRLDQALDAYENGETVEEVAKADAKGSKSMGEDAIAEANGKKFDSMKASLDLDYGEENHFAKSLIRTSDIEVRVQYGEGDATIYTVIDGSDSTLKVGSYSFSWNESEKGQTIDDQSRRLVDQLLGLEAIRVRVVEGLNIKKGGIDFVVHYDGETDTTTIGNPMYTAKVAKGKGGVLGASKANKWMPEGDIILEANFVYEGPFGEVVVPAGRWATIASMFDTKRDSSRNFAEDNLNRNGGAWGALAKCHSSEAKTHTLHRKGYRNPKGATTGGRVIEGLLEAMPTEQGKELAELLKVKNGELSFAEVSPKFRKLFGYDDDEATIEETNEETIDGDVEGNE
jgi:hypothetical protein